MLPASLKAPAAYWALQHGAALRCLLHAGVLRQPLLLVCGALPCSAQPTPLLPRPLPQATRRTRRCGRRALTT
jgi:hypothetical protein